MFPRGFKSWCENVAIQQRKELGLRPYDPLDPKALAQHLGVDVWTVEQVPGLSRESLAILTQQDRDSWSAVTVCTNSKHLIILNSSHTGGRPASNLAHELAHVLLGHKPARVDVSEDGMLILNSYHRQQEEEAAWLAGCLLLTHEALMAIQHSRLDLGGAARKYGVSLDMLRYRLRVSGAQKHFKRFRQYTTSTGR